METLYDIADWKIYNLNLLVLPLIWLFAFTLTFIISYIAKPSKSPRRTFFSWQVIIINLFFFVLILNISYNFVKYRSILINSKSEVIDGRLVKYVPQSFFGKHNEVMQVDSLIFYYNMNNISHIGFRKTKGLGNILEQGDSIRVHYVDNHILKLEKEIKN